MAPSIGTFVLSHEKVRTFCDEHYKKVRERFGLGDDFLDSRGRGAGGARLRGDDRAARAGSTSLSSRRAAERAVT